MLTLLLFTATAVAVGLALHRDVRAAVARRRAAVRWGLGRVSEFGAAAAAGGVSMGEALAAAAAFERSMRQVAVTLTFDTSRFEAAVRHASQNLGKDDRP